MLRRKVKDYYFYKAKREHYAARSVYKLKEADEKYKFLHRRGVILDLGCFPGSWLQYCAEAVGPQGFVLGIDQQELKSLPGPNTRSLQADVLALDPEEIKKTRDAFDVVLSDMAPQTSGVKIVDHTKSIELARAAFLIAGALLRTGGTLFVKVFQGEDLPAFKKEIEQAFAQVRFFKPKGSRPESKEVFILALNKRP
ncbi:MAG: RlmE family RNA methyltransferase [Desulfovibrionales bacterium]|nr:RlmE family RNA methyltransferase [Desulfovibrionales bacterium]